MKARVDAAKYLVYAAALKKQAIMNGEKGRYSVEAADGQADRRPRPPAT